MSLIRFRRPAGQGLSPAGWEPSCCLTPAFPENLSLPPDSESGAAGLDVGRDGPGDGSDGNGRGLALAVGQGKARPRAGGSSGCGQASSVLGLMVAGASVPWFCVRVPRGKWVGRLPGWV